MTTTTTLDPAEFSQKLDAIQSQIDALRSQLSDAVNEKSAKAVFCEAIDSLQKLSLTAEPKAVRVAASKAIAELAIKFQDLEIKFQDRALERRLSGLEDVLIQILAESIKQWEANQKMAARISAISKTVTDRDYQLENGDL